MASEDSALGRKIRLKHLLDEGQAIENLVPQQTSLESLDAIRNIIATSDHIIGEGSVKDRASNTTEVVLDAQVLKMSHELVSKVLLQSSEFNDRMYQIAINSIVYKSDDVNWNAIANIACSIACTTRTKSTMLGAIDAQPRERIIKERQQRKKNTLAEEKRPEELDKIKRQSKGAQKVNIIHKQVKDIFNRNNRQPIPFYQLIIDPHNFMNTVENAFQLAFLARDSIIAIQTGDDENPTVRLTTPEELKSDRETKQSICSLDPQLCQDMIRLYDIKEPMLIVPKETESGDDDE